MQAASNQSRSQLPFTSLSNRKGRALVLSLRHLGDAVIGAGLINTLTENNPNLEIDILGRSNLKAVFEELASFHEFVEIDLPLFRHHRKRLQDIRSAYRTIASVRTRRYDYCVNLIGDIRENFVGKLTGAKYNIAPIWEAGHLFKRKMTDTGASLLLNAGISMPASESSFYKSIERFAGGLGLPGLRWKQAIDSSTKDDALVALHPGASHPSRQWPSKHWQDLARSLHHLGYSLIVLGASPERAHLLDIFNETALGFSPEIFTGNMHEFFLRLVRVKTLIGMDSFSVHAAYALGIPAVVLNGSADPSILTPPGCIPVSAGHLCNQFPCYYNFSCEGTAQEYICSRGIECRDVLIALEKLAARGLRSGHETHGRIVPPTADAPLRIIGQ